MKKNFPLLLVTNMLILLSSCASLNENSLKKATTGIEYDSLSPKLSKEELAKIIKAKIDSREYRIDLTPQAFTGEEGINLYIPEYFQVCGDSIISCMIYDNPFPGSFPPKNYIQHMRSIKYEILDYQQTETRRGRIIVSFGYKIKYDEYDPYLLAKYKDRLVPVYYKLEFGKTTEVRVIQQNRYLMFGTLSLEE